MPLGLSPLHLIVILIIALIIVGPGKLPEVGGALGKSIREFRKAASDINPATGLEGTAPAVAPAAPAAAPVAPAPVPPVVAATDEHLPA
jgi:sec-independent protein translocase protein TatA